MVDQLLSALERYDTFDGQTALNKAFNDIFGSTPDSDAGRVLWQEFTENNSFNDSLNNWASTRLDNWHSIKMNALESAWRFDENVVDIEGTLKAVLIDLRQGIHDHPELLADAHFIQNLAKAAHSFSFTQAIKELKANNPNYQLSDDLIKKHCLICANAFKFLVG